MEPGEVPGSLSKGNRCLPCGHLKSVVSQKSLLAGNKGQDKTKWPQDVPGKV